LERAWLQPLLLKGGGAEDAAGGCGARV